MRTRYIGSFFLLVAVCLTAGCGGRTKINGKIVKNGQPFTVSDKGVFVLSFLPESGTKTVYNATTKPDGTFTIVGPDGKGIPSGKYKVQLTAMDPYPKTDKLGGKFAPGQSNLIIDIGSGDLVVDVAK